MQVLIIFACAAFACASYIPYQGHNQYDQKYGSAAADNHAFQYGNYGQYGNAAKDNKYGYVKGGNNVQHEEYHTATKHKIDEEKHEITHKADNKLAGASHQDHANKYGNSYNAGANQHYADKGASGKDASHASASHQGALGYGAHGAHQVADKHAASEHASYANSGAAADNKHGAQNAYAAASADQAHKKSDFVNHYELHNKKNEDYAHKEASHKSDKNNLFQYGYNAHNANGAGQHHSDYAAGDTSKHQNAYGYQNSHPGYYGASLGHAAGAAGAGHYDHKADQGAYNYHQAGAGQYHGGNQKNHADEKNTFKSVVRKINKEEHEVKHDDGKDRNAYGNQYAQQAHNNYDAAHKAAQHGAHKDSAYNKHDSHYAAAHHQPAAHYYPSHY